MNFSSPTLVEQVLWDLRTADQPRGQNRAQIDRLFDGFPPWTPEEVESNQIRTNVNWLDAPKLAADARRSYYNAFLKPANYFSMTLDTGPARSRSSWSAIVTKEINRVMKRSLPYFEVVRSQMASTVLHGIGPVHWSDEFSWRPRAVDIADLMIPSNTLLSLENLDYFGVFRQYTATELADKIERANVDPGWNKDLARRAVKWAASQTSGQSGTGFQNDWLSWEKVVDRIKEDGVYYGSDVIPTIDCWDFYYFSEEGKRAGWRRCMVLDTPATNQIGSEKPSKNLIGEDNSEWLYNGKERTYADSIGEILHFQFGDLSPRAPFKYHSVRSLGWLIYAVCNLQNRLRCKINDATFESLLNYFRVGNPDDNDRLTKIDLHNYGVVPEGVEFVKQQDRWQVNHALVQGTMADNRAMLNEAASQFREGRDNQSGKEKTATEIMAEVNSANALVGSMLLLAYNYQKSQYSEIARRFFKENSTDKEVREFRLRVLKKGVPTEMLDMDYWDVQPEQVLGSGNKMLQIAMADKLMAVRPLLDPDSQRDALRLYVEANSDDAGLGSRWVPDKPVLVTESTHDAQLMVGTIMSGATVDPSTGQDAGQITLALLKSMAEICQRILNTTRLPSLPEVVGLTNLAGTIERYIQQLGQDKNQADLAKQATADLTELTKIVKAWSDELQQSQQAQQQQQDPEAAKEIATTQAKIKAITVTAQTKAQISKANAAQKQQQRDEQFRQKQQQSEESHIADLRKKLRETEVDTTIADIKAASDISNARQPETTP
jgi:hypothetical protein